MPANPSTQERVILITGGAGFIGSHVVRLFVSRYPGYRIVNLDNLTYAGNLENLRDVEKAPNYTFVRGDITDEHFLTKLFRQYRFDSVIHLAAESHVDRSILSPMEFIHTNILGTVLLMNAARMIWEEPGQAAGAAPVFYHVSTDEVYGSLGNEGFFREDTRYDPHSPYSASKASSDHMVRAYYHTYKFPAVISNCSNNYGPFQFPEKLIPLVIHNIKNSKPVPVYGKGENVRDWLWVIDHARAIDLAFHKGKHGETYNIGGGNEWTNIDLVQLICRIMDGKLGRTPGTSASLITYVKDRPGHDLRYAIDAGKIGSELDWSPSITFEEGIEKTIDWYLGNEPWLQHVTSGSYQKYYEAQYGDR